MKRFTTFAILALAGCTPAQQAQLNSVVVAGQLFCSVVAGGTGANVVAIATTSNVPVSVIGKTSAEVAAICQLVNGLPVVPPATGAPVAVKPVAPVA
jgi:hypothetical protein